MNKPFREYDLDGSNSTGTSAADDFCPLEERILFDGAAAAEALDVVQDHAGDDAAENEALLRHEREQAGEALASAVSEVPETFGAEIFFIDAGIDDSDDLISAIPDGAEVVLLEAETDGVVQIASVLQSRTDVTAIHILSHGEPGQINLGNAQLDEASISGKHADALSAIGNALSEDADILIYGCDFGQDQTALIALANATSADVAVSSDKTGAAELGGDWQLEVTHGAIETETLVASEFDGLLAAPTLTVPAQDLAVSEDNVLTITDVSVSDNDGDPLSVTLDVTNGTITLAQTTNLTVSGDGSGSVTLSGDAADINDALSGMTYSPASDFNGADALAIEVNDGGPAVNESVGIQIASVNDDPSLSPVNAAANESATITLTAANFGLNDPDLDVTSNTNPQLPKQIVFKLVDGSLTSNGTLQLSGAPLLAGSTFSLQDILDGKLTYTHDGSDVALGDSDSFAVTVSDGGGAGDLGPTNIAIDLFPLNQTPTIGGAPSVFEGQGTEDEFGTPGTITEAADIGDSLSISDRDDAAANSTITITNIDNAGEGTLFWDANGDGRLDPGEALTGGETFDADELANGRLRFAHNGDEVDGTNPSFDIEVTDDGGGAGTPLSSGPTTINIAVEPNDDNPDLATNTGLTVPSGGSATITSADLESTDPDTADQSIVYVVTEIPTKGELRINGEIVGVGARFTQADIDNGLLDYNSTSAVTDGETDTFKFEVRDSTQRAFNNPGLEGADRNPDGTVTEHTFTITLSGTLLTGTDPGDPAPGRSGVVEILDPSTNTGIVVTEGDGAAGGADTAVISSVELSTVLQTNDGNGGTLAVPPEETVYRITSAPGNGTLLLSGTALGNYDTFTQADIDAGNLSFVHDGSENHQDEFAFSVTGGTAAEFDGTFSLRAIPINDTPSVATNDLPLLPEGATTRVTTAFIGLGDVDTNDESGEGGGVNDPNNEAVSDNLWFRVTDLPDNGTLERFDGANWLAVATDDLLHSSLLTASADGQTSGLRYTHDGSENHSDSFSVQVRDDLPPLTDPSDPFEVLSESGEGPAAGGNLSGIGTVNAVFAPQNDAPITPQNQSGADSTIEDANGVFQTTANDTLFLEEGDTAEIGTSLLKAVDPDNTDPETLQYRITAAPANGVLSLGGSILGPGSTFTQADIDNGSFSYTHDGSENFSDQFEFVVSDSVADHVYSDADGATGGASVFSIEIDGGRNDPPEVANGGADTIDLFGTFTHNFGTSLTVADPDIDDGNVDTGTGEVDFLQVTVVLKDSGGNNVDLSTGGGITLGSTSGLTQTDANDDDGDLVFQGSFVDVQAALTDLQVELPNQDFNDTFTLEVTVDDRLRDASGALTGGANGDDDGTDNADDTPINEANNTDSVSVTFRASDDNDDPTATAVPGDQEVNEDTVLDLSGYVIDDVDAFDSDLTVDLAVTSGHLSVTGDATTSDPSTLTLTGTLSEINAQLANLTYIANADFHSRDGATSDLVDDDTLTITVNDGGSNGTGGGTDVSLTSTNIAINPVNDAPTLSVPGTQTLASGGSITFSGASAPTVGDPQDVGNSQPFTDQHRVTVSVPTGKGTLAGSGATALTDQDAGAETLVLEGTLADINAELNGLVYTPVDPNADETVTITVLFEDLANGGTTLADGVGGNLSVTDSFDVRISSVNDGPSVNTLTDQSVDEDSSLTFSSGNGNAFSISDPDDFGADMEVTVSVDHGVVTVASGSGATVSDDGTATVTITGTESEINAALDGLVYTPTADFHTVGVVGDTITVTIDDLGNTGTGGAKSSTETAEITVVPVNDRPTATGGPEDVAVVGEDQTGAGVTLGSLLGANYDDATDDQTPDGGDSSTAFSFVAITGSTDYDPAQGTWQVSDGSGGWIDVPASGLDDDNALVVDVAREIRFVSAADFHGTPGTLQVRLADGDAIDTITASTGAGDLKDLSSEGGTDQTGRWSAGTVTIQTSVANENDPPSGSDATLAAIDEDNTTAGGDTVANLFSSVFSDATDDQSGITGGGDASTTLGGIAVIGSSADAATEGTWQYSTNGGGSWTDIPQSADDDASAILLPDDALLRFVPVADFNGTPGSLSVRLADAVQTFNASSDISAVVGDDPSRDTDIWSAPINLNTSITPRNDAPVLTAAVTSAAVSESTSPNTGTNPTAFILGAGVSDLDIATTAALGQFGAGTITVSMDDSGQSFDQLTISNASLPGIASVSGGSNGSDLVIDLLPTATTAQVEVLVEALRYSSSSDTFSGTRDITVTLSDGNNENGGGNDAGGPAPLTDSLSASVTITEQNDPPDASDNTVTTNEDTSYTFSAADFNFVQPGGETDAMDGVRIDTLPGSGTLELNGIAITAGDLIAQSDIDAGNLTYEPPADQNGAGLTDFTFSVRDDRGAFDTAPNTMTINVDPVDDGVADSFSTAEDTPLSADVSTNDTHGANASYSLNTDAANGSVAMAPDGTFTYTPDPDYNGPDSFTYDVTDVNGDTETVTVDLTVTPVDDALVITGLTDGAVAGTDGSVDEGDLADGTTPGGDGETVTGAFTVSVADGIGTLEVGGTTLTGTELLGLGATPVTVATPLGALTLTGFDPETGAVSYSYTLSGAADHSGGAVTEDIALVLTDGDGDTAAGTLSVAVLDDAPVANAEIDEAISTPGNPSSVAQGNVVTGVDGSAEPNTTDGVADVLGADGAAAGGPVTGVVFGTGTPAAGDVGASVDGDHGTLVLEADGSYSYTPDYADPAVAALGPGDSLTEVFTYEITDADGGTATATLSVTILGTPAIAGLNDGTVPGSDGTVLESDLADGSNAVGTGDVLAGSFQAIAPEGVVSVTVGGTVLTAAQLEALTPAAPAVIVTPLGTLTLTGYDPSTGAIDYVYTLADDVDHSGGDVTDDIAVSVTDALGDTGTGTLSVAVLDDAPVAVDDTASLGEDDAAPVTGNVVTGNDVLGADETPSPVTGVVAGTGTPAGNVGTGVVGSYGTVTLNADGSYAYTLDTTDPAVQGLQAGETLTEVFTYEITDADGDTATATLTLTVTGSNDAPMAVADSATTPEDTPVTGTLLGNDSDADGDPLEVTQVLVDLDGDGTPDVLPLGTATPLSDAAGDPIGTLTVNPDGSFTFVPAPNYDGPVPQASYTITDGNGGTATSTLDITITPVDDAPVAGQPISPSGRGTEFPDDPWTERVPLIVDHIVGETANAESSLNSTPDLLSGVNTDLAVTHPILTALNGLQDLGGIEQLGTVSPEYFGGVDAGGPIQQAVRGIGFEPLADRFELFNRDFPDGAANVGELVTRSGFFIRLAVAVGRLEPGLVAEAWTPSGDAMPVRNMILEPDQDDNFDAESAEFSGGVLSVRIELETGQDIKLDVQLAQEAGYNVICWAKETETETFAEQTERFAKFGEYETARLMQALRGS